MGCLQTVRPSGLSSISAGMQATHQAFFRNVGGGVSEPKAGRWVGGSRKGFNPAGFPVSPGATAVDSRPCRLGYRPCRAIALQRFAMPKMTRRQATAKLALWMPAALLTNGALAQAQPFPSKPIEWVVPYPAGGGSDVAARTLADAMGKALGQTLVINNRPGAGTNIGADYAAHAKADGHVMLTADTATLAANPWLYSKLGYSAERDFAAVGLIGRFNLLLVVNPGVPAGTFKEFLAWAKSQPQPVPFATPGAGSPHHLAMELLRSRTGLALTHVPYRGAAPAVQDVVGGQVPAMFVDSAAGYAQISAGKLRAFAVASPARLANLAQVPTFAEQGLPSFEAYAWQGLVVPTGTPAAVVQQLNQALRAALDSTAVKARFQVLGIAPTPSTPEAMAAYAGAERARWGAIIQKAGIKLD